MKKLITILSLFVSSASIAQDKGIKFEHDFNQALQKAKSANKMLYVDVYTTWCGPCKTMAKKYFTDEQIGKLWDSLTVSAKVDAENGEGVNIAKKYKVQGYPTNLFINPVNEKIIYRTSGCPNDKAGFIGFMNSAITEKNDPMTIDEYTKKFKSNNYDEQFLLNYIDKNTRIGEKNQEALDAYFGKYYNNKKDSILNFKLNENYGALDLDSKITQHFDKNYNTISAEQKVIYENILGGIIMNASSANNDKVYTTALDKISKIKPNESFMYASKLFELESVVKNPQKYLTYSNKYIEPILKINDKTIEALDNNTKQEIYKSIASQMQMGGITDTAQINKVFNENYERIKIQASTKNQLSQTLNTLAWNVYEKFPKNKSLLLSAVNWANKAMQLVESNKEMWCPAADTYAHLLYASGNKPKAIATTNNIIKIVKENNISGLEDYEKALKDYK